jgi:hypothetical protein
LSIDTSPSGDATVSRRPLVAALPLGTVALRITPYALTALIVAVAGLPMLIMPLHPDQATFAMMGRAVAEGRFPYKDILDQKPPALFLIYAVAVHGPFDVMRNVRAFDIAWTTATAVVLLELGRRWWGLRAGVIAALVYGLVHVNNDPWWQSAQPDSMVVLPLALALLLYDAARGGRGRLIAAGVLLGVACQLRFQMVLYVPFVPLVELAGALSGRVRLWLHRMVWLGVGFVALQAVLLLYLIVGGALHEFILTMRYAAGYTRTGGPWNPPGGPTLPAYLRVFRDGFLFWSSFRLVLVLPAVVGGFYGAFLLREPRVQRLVIFAVLSYIAVALQAKFFWYHYGHLFLSLSLLGGWTWDRTIRALGRSWPRPVAYLVTGVIAAVLVLNTSQVRDDALNEWKSFIRFYAHPEEREFYYAFVRGGYANLRQTAFYVRERTQPGDSIYVWGFDPAIYLLADRPTASRFLFSFPLMSDWTPPEWKVDFVQELARNRPVYFIVERGGTATWIVGYEIDMADYIGWYPTLHQWLEAHYEIETEIGGSILYHRKE